MKNNMKIRLIVLLISASVSLNVDMKVFISIVNPVSVAAADDNHVEETRIASNLPRSSTPQSEITAEPATSAPSSRSSPRPLTVADGIETTRIKPDFTNHQVAHISPDGKHYVVALVKGDLKRNGLWLELISGSLDSIDAASKYNTIARLFTEGKGSMYGHSDQLTWNYFNPIVWLRDNERVALLWGDGTAQHPIQAIAVNTRTHKVDRLTNHPTDVQAFAVNRDGSIFYAATAHRQNTSDELFRRGFTVRNADLMSVLHGEVDGWGLDDRWFNFERFIAESPGTPPRKLIIASRSYEGIDPRPAEFSPDGKYAIVDAAPEGIPLEWDAYTNAYWRRVFRAARTDSNGRDARLVKKLFVVKISDGSSYPLWQAPVGFASTVRWAPDSRSVLVGPTFLPLAARTAAGLDGSAVAEVSIVDGSFRSVPIPDNLSLKKGVDLSWVSSDQVEVSLGKSRQVQFRRVHDTWRQVASGVERRKTQTRQVVKIELKQGLNEPPAVYAVDARSGREKLIIDPNPQLLEKFTLGRVKHVTWSDRKDRTWSGLLYYPVNYSSARRYPLVIQTHGHALIDEFSLYGKGDNAPGLGPSWSVFAAQPLANRGIAVLQVEDKRPPGIVETPEEAELHVEGYTAAAEHFTSVGLAEKGKIGIMGYSRTGWYVLAALTRSRFRYAAAILADGSDAGYMQYTSGFPGIAEMNGSEPFSEGLAKWHERAPPFQIESVRAPVQLQLHIAGLPFLLGKWEVFQRLRRLGKPTELYVIPDIEHGSHAIQNPEQCLAAQQRAVDWFDFWLNDFEESEIKKAEQYQDWRELRHQRNAVLQNGTPRDVNE